MYPLKFKPILKQNIWGGQKLLEVKKGQYRNADLSCRYGESWDVSGLDGNASVVANGFLKGNNLQEIVEVYMGDLVGESVFERHGLEFPLLFKWLDCNDKLSVQVHPDDKIAAERHDSFGKTEMWYIESAKPGAVIYIGFKDKDITREQYIEAVADGTVADIIQPVEVKAGDVFYIPAGTIHALADGVSVVEIQQSSDITYRIFDWNRVDADGKSRELHTAQAVDVIDFTSTAEDCRRTYTPKANEAVEMVRCENFTTNILRVEGDAERDYCKLDSFVVYICTEGSVTLDADGNTESLKAGEVVMIPAEVNSVSLSGNGLIIESYIG